MCQDAIVDPDGDLGDDCFDDFDEAIIAPLSNPVLQKYTMVNADVMKVEFIHHIIIIIMVESFLGEGGHSCHITFEGWYW